MRTKNILRCPQCGFEVLSEANARNCAKCNAPMTLIGKGESKGVRR